MQKKFVVKVSEKLYKRMLKVKGIAHFSNMSELASNALGLYCLIVSMILQGYKIKFEKPKNSVGLSDVLDNVEKVESILDKIDIEVWEEDSDEPVEIKSIKVL